MRRTAMHVSALALVALGGCAIDWKVPDPPAPDGGAGSGGGSGAAGGSGAGSAAGAGGTAPCGEEANCAACLSCAGGIDCDEELDACFQDPHCWPIAQCAMDPCLGSSDGTCADRCVTGHRQGEALFYELLTCLACDACVLSCPEMASWACSGT
jgi:hypothetical protein